MRKYWFVRDFCIVGILNACLPTRNFVICKMHSYKGHLKDNPGFRPLYKNFSMLLGHIFEEVYCINLITNEEFGIWQFPSDPTCGVIGKNNDWCLVGSESLVLKTFFDRTVRPVGDLRNIHELRLINEYTAKILTDPWAEDAAIWQLEIDVNRFAPDIGLWKIRDFNDYTGKPYVEDVLW